jgi:hypothetical protein
MAGLARKSPPDAAAGCGPVFPSNVPQVKLVPAPARAVTTAGQKLTADRPTIK